MKILNLMLLCAAIATAGIATSAQASGKFVKRGAVQNEAGGVTAGRLAARKGPNGGAMARGSAVQTDGAGNATAASGGAFKTANGASGARASKSQVNADGSASRSGGFAAQGSKGAVQSQGNVTRTADGQVNGDRTTSATGAAGGTYNAQTTYNKTDGVTRTATCTSPGGEVVPCKK